MTKKARNQVKAIPKIPTLSVSRRESLLYPGCIPDLCGASWQDGSLGPEVVQELLKEVLHLWNEAADVVFWGLDLVTGKLVKDGFTRLVEEVELRPLKTKARIVAEILRQHLEERYNVSGLLLTFPAVISGKWST